MRCLGKREFALLYVLFISGALLAQTATWKLSQCIDSAIANNITILQDINTIELSRLNLKQSKNNLLPAINGSVTGALSVGRLVNPVTDLYETGNVWTAAPGIALTQNLFDGLQYLNTIKQNTLTYQSSKYDLEDAKFNLTVSVVNAFLQVLYASESVKIAQLQVGLDNAQLQVTSDLLYVGKATESALLQVKAQWHADQFTVVNNQSLLRVAKVNLQQLMNLPVSEGFDIDYSSAQEPQIKGLEDISSIYSQSLAFQPIIKSFGLKTQSAVFALKVVRGAYYPQLIFKATGASDYSSYAKQTTTVTSSTLQKIGYLQGDPSQTVIGEVPQATTKVENYPFGNQMGDNLNGQFSVTLSIPILNYLSVRNNVKRQIVNLNNAVLSEENSKLTLRKTIEQVYTNVQNSNSQYVSAMEEVESAKAAYDVSAANFQQGKEIITNLITQKNAYSKALSDYLQAKYGLIFNSKILDYYKGVPITH